MRIVSSQIVEDSPQIDGRRWVREVHTDDAGLMHEFAYLAEAASNVSAIMAARAADLPDQLLRSIEDQEFGNGIFTS